MLTQIPDLDSMESLIDAILKLYISRATSIIQKRAVDDKMGDTKPWRELHHVSGRLVSYRYAVEILRDASVLWPELFDNFTVHYVPSSTRGPNPLPAEVQTAAEIAARIATSDQDKPRCKQLAEEAQRLHGLDQTIERQWTSRRFRPIVHGELLLLNWLENNGGTAPSRFFGAWAYIGGSKPTCRLCHYYLSSHPSGVRARPTHGNLYPNWRMPDGADVQGGSAEDDPLKVRLEMIQKVTAPVRQDALRTLAVKVVHVQAHDSNTVSSIVLRRDAAGGVATGARRLSLVGLVEAEMAGEGGGVAVGDINEHSNEERKTA